MYQSAFIVLTHKPSHDCRVLCESQATLTDMLNRPESRALLHLLVQLNICAVIENVSEAVDRALLDTYDSQRFV